MRVPVLTHTGGGFTKVGTCVCKRIRQELHVDTGVKAHTVHTPPTWSCTQTRVHTRTQNSTSAYTRA